MEHQNVHAVLNILPAEFDNSANYAVDRTGNMPVTGPELLLLD
jgi:hypothetical protein